MSLTRCFFYALAAMEILIVSSAVGDHALARDFGQYANVSQEIRDWYRNAELTEAAQQRLPWKKCCDHTDVVKTQFRVSKSTGSGEWYWLHDGHWKRIPSDIIHWGVSLPGGAACAVRLRQCGDLFLPWRTGDPMLNGSPYLRNGAPQRCALCDAPLLIADEHFKCWRGSDQRYYGCPEHAFGLERALAAVEPGRRKMS